MRSAQRVLVVDDDREIVQALSVRLRAMGHEPLAAYDGESGLALAIETIPDAIVLDMRMPAMDGLKVLAGLRAGDATRDIPVIVLSASLVDRATAVDQGAFCFIEKPYDAKVLAAALNQALSVRLKKDT